MQALTVSQYLYAQDEGKVYNVINKLTHKQTSCSQDMINAIQNLQRNKGLLNKAYEKFFVKEDILINQNQREKMQKDLLYEWAEKFQKKVYRREENAIHFDYVKSVEEEIDIFLHEISNVVSHLNKEFKDRLAGITHIRICFLKAEEFKKLAICNNIPNSVSAFLNQKCILILNYEMFYEDSTLFYPTIRHELMHLIIASNAYNIPFWIEEGICELYAYRMPTEMINMHIRKDMLLDFRSIDTYKYYTVGEFSKHHAVNQRVYMQCQSIAGYLLTLLGEEIFWQMLSRIDITFRIDKLFEIYYKKDLRTIAAEWKHFIKGEERNDNNV